MYSCVSYSEYFYTFAFSSAILEEKQMVRPKQKQMKVKKHLSHHCVMSASEVNSEGKKVRETVWARKSKVWRKPGKGHRQQDIDESESGVSGPSGHFPRTWQTFPAMNNNCRVRSHSRLQPAPIYLIKITAECKRAVLLIFITGKFKGEETHFWQSSE